MKASIFTGFRTAEEFPSLKRYITLHFWATGSVEAARPDAAMTGSAIGRPKKSTGGCEGKR